MGYLYVIKANKYCKVGVTERSAYGRAKIVQTGCPFPIEKLWTSRDIPNYRECEREMHKRLKKFKTNGEWFNHPFENICLLAEEVTGTSNEQALINENKDLKAKVKILTKEVETLRKALNSDIPLYSNQWG